MKKLLLGLFLMGGQLALASSSRTIDSDALISSDHTKTYVLPSANDTLVGLAATQTLTNKSISGSSNTFSSIPVSSFAGSGTSGWVLTSTGTSSAPAYAPAPTANRFIPAFSAYTSGTGTYYTPFGFVVSTASATSGAVYSNNGGNFTVATTISNGASLIMTGSGTTPTASGTLTKVSGTGDSTITFSSYSTPLYIHVRAVGGGGGGGGGGSGTPGTGSAGGSTTFGSSLLTCNGGTAGSTAGGSSIAAGGSASIGSGATGVALPGGSGVGGNSFNITGYAAGEAGGASAFGGTGASAANSAGSAGGTNTGAGGGGGGSTASGGGSGGGGGAGGFVDAIIFNPGTSYPYAIGTGGGGGSAGTNGLAGAAGAAGLIYVTASFQ